MNKAMLPAFMTGELGMAKELSIIQLQPSDKSLRYLAAALALNADPSTRSSLPQDEVYRQLSAGSSEVLAHCLGLQHTQSPHRSTLLVMDQAEELITTPAGRAACKTLAANIEQ